MAPKMPPTSKSVERSADNVGPSVPAERDNACNNLNRLLQFGKLTGRLYVEWQPVHEGVADELGEEETQ